MPEMKNHNVAEPSEGKGVRFERRPVKDRAGNPVEGLYTAWIILDNASQLNSYTTEMVKQVILSFRAAANARDVVATVFTGAGDRAFCTGGNTKEYAEYYAGNPQEYRQYMRLFNDMVSAILACDKPVICRVNGMRIAGGQEIGMACDFSVAQDLARFGQSGPRHGSAPVGGSTDFLHLFLGMEHGMGSATLCEHWSAHKAMRLGLLTDVVPALRIDGKLVPNPTVVTDHWVDAATGRIVYGEPKEGDALADGKALLKSGEIDLGPLDDAVDGLVTKLLYTFPECLTKTIEEMRKKKLEHWEKNKESSRAWLALNMMTEARAGFRAFNEGTGKDRDADFIELRRALARGEPWTDALLGRILPGKK